MSTGWRVSRAGSGRIGRAVRAARGGDGPTSGPDAARWELAGRLGDCVDGAAAAGDEVAVSRLSLATLRVLDSLGRAAVKRDAGGVTSTGGSHNDGTDSIDRAYAELCSSEIRDPSDPDA